MLDVRHAQQHRAVVGQVLGVARQRFPRLAHPGQRRRVHDRVEPARDVERHDVELGRRQRHLVEPRPGHGGGGGIALDPIEPRPGVAQPVGAQQVAPPATGVHHDPRR
jgi:hypothetical protein